MIINSNEVAELMPEITSVIKTDVFSIGGIGLLIIEGYGEPNAASACASVRYEFLDEMETIEWMAENT